MKALQQVLLVGTAAAALSGCGDDTDTQSEAQEQVTEAQCLSYLSDRYSDPSSPPDDVSSREMTCRQAGYDPVWEDKGIDVTDDDYFAYFAGAESQVESSVPSTEMTPSPAPTDTVPPSTTPPANESLMPDVVCMNLQDAQDLIQTTGVFYSRSFDATGEGRSQIMDSNWIVVSQDPAPGTPITEGSANLGAVKYGEPNSC